MGIVFAELSSAVASGFGIGYFFLLGMMQVDNRAMLKFFTIIAYVWVYPLSLGQLY